jgi:sugar phosphate isomerase/epimerase
MIDRRKFLKASTGAMLGGLYVVNSGCMDDTAPAGISQTAATRSLDRIGVQLYTVRDRLAEDFAGTIEQVAAIGYDEVEFAGYYDHSAEQVRELLDRVGLTAPAAHHGPDAVRDDLPQLIADAKIVGHEYIVIPYLQPPMRTMEGYQQLIALLNEAGARCRDEGLRIAYHNHDFEFEDVDGIIPFDMILEETDPDLVDIELDLFWIVKGGYDPLSYFERYPGRFALCHVKDMADPAGEQAMVAVGDGDLDFASMFAASGRAGLNHYFVEHDRPQDSLASIRTSYEYLSALAI